DASDFASYSLLVPTRGEKDEILKTNLGIVSTRKARRKSAISENFSCLSMENFYLD
ncbi:46363_t:CDS:2, partial [Gigaspora margarita]